MMKGILILTVAASLLGLGADSNTDQCKLYEIDPFVSYMAQVHIYNEYCN